MRTYTAQKGDRLDSIVFKEYGTLEHLDKVLEANPHLVTKVAYDDGDVVNLPVIEVPKKEIKVKTLW